MLLVLHYVLEAKLYFAFYNIYFKATTIDFYRLII